MEDKQLIEVNGIKLEVDMRYAKRVDTFRVGDPVKLLVKDGYSGLKVCAGIVAGFEPFQSNPTIIIAYIADDYSSAELKFAYINESSKEKYELVSSMDNELPIEKAWVIEKMESAITKAEEQVRDLKAKKRLFLEKFGRHFEAEETANA